jgi:hypothetical protein
VRFSVYLRRFGKLIKLYKLHRNDQGFYIWSFKSKDYISYHEDGKYWTSIAGRKTVKQIHQRLSIFKGTETPSVSVTSILAPMPDDKDESLLHIKAENIVLDLAGNFCVEIILSAEKIDLPYLPERSTSVVHSKDGRFPAIIIEAFLIADSVFPNAR